MTRDIPEPGFRELIRSDASAGGIGTRSPLFYVAAMLGLNKFSAVLLFRIASTLRRRGRIGGFLASGITRINTLYNSCELSPRAQIGPGLHIAHTIGICIGPIVAGRNLTLLHHASIGIGDRDLDHDDVNNYPVIGNDVQIGPGAVVLGPIRIGDGATIAANAVVLQNVPAGGAAFGNPARVMKRTEPGLAA